MSITTFTVAEMAVLSCAGQMAFDETFGVVGMQGFTGALDPLLDKLRGIADDYPAVSTVFELRLAKDAVTAEQFNDLLYCVEVYLENMGDAEADDPELFARITRLPKMLANKLGDLK